MNSCISRHCYKALLSRTVSRSSSVLSHACRQFSNSSSTYAQFSRVKSPQIGWNNVLESEKDPPKNTTKKRESADKIWLERHQRAASTMLAPHDTYSGRSIAVPRRDDDSGVAAASSRLFALLSANKIVREFKLGQRHQKKYRLRQILDSRRWRRFFLHAVKKKVRLVKAISKTGV